MLEIFQEKFYQIKSSLKKCFDVVVEYTSFPSVILLPLVFELLHELYFRAYSKINYQKLLERNNDLVEKIVNSYANSRSKSRFDYSLAQKYGFFKTKWVIDAIISGEIFVPEDKHELVKKMTLLKDSFLPINLMSAIGFITIYYSTIFIKITLIDPVYVKYRALEILGVNNIDKVMRFNSLNQLKALEFFGVKEAWRAEEITSKNQLKAIEILGVEAAWLAHYFTNESHLKALEILGVENASLATAYHDERKLKALEILGTERADLACAYSFESQMKALEILGVENAELSLKFTSEIKLKALEILGVERAELAKEFNSEIKLKALEVLGVERVELAKEFNSEIKLKALEILGVERAKLASKFYNDNQLKALKILCAENAELALSYTSESSLDELTSRTAPAFDDNQVSEMSCLGAESSDICPWV